jgi:hypothetical protein
MARRPLLLLTPLLLPAFSAITSRPRGAVPSLFQCLRGGGGGGLDINTLLEAAQDPEAAAELQRLMEDPEAMREARELMDDPEFRRQVQEALASGGSKVNDIRRAVSGNGELRASLKQLGPSLGASLDVLRQGTEHAEFEAACGALEGLVRRLATRGGTEPKYRRVRLSNPALLEKLLQHAGGRRCLEAIGFSEEEEEAGEAHLVYARDDLSQHPAGDAVDAASPLGRALETIVQAREEAGKAAELAAAQGLAYRVACELPSVRRACVGDEELGQLVTQVLLSNTEFKEHTSGGNAELALPAITQLLRSREGLQGLVEYYTGAALYESRVKHVGTVSEWKDALVAAGDKPVCALLSSAQLVGCRLLGPAFARLPDAADGAFEGVEFLQCTVDQSKDDGLAVAVLAENGVELRELPTFLFIDGCLELRKWRYAGADIAQVTKRLRRVSARDGLEDGPDEYEDEDA